QPGPVIGIAQRDAELALDQRVRDALVVGPEALRHRRQRRRVERFQRRRRDAEEPCGMGDYIGGRGRLVVADIVGGARAGLFDRGAQHCREVVDMDAREHLPRPIEAAGGAGAQRVEGTAARPVDAGEAEDMGALAAPALLGQRTPGATCAAWPQPGGLVDPGAVAVAVDPCRREIADPFGAGAILGRTARLVGRDRHQDVGRARPCLGGQLLLLGRAGDLPAVQGSDERLGAVAEAEAEQLWHQAGARAVSSSDPAIWRCLRRAAIHIAHETAAPTASGSRRPKCSLSVPISTAPTAGPARNIMPYKAITRPRMRESTAAWISVCAPVPVIVIAAPAIKTQGKAR